MIVARDVIDVTSPRLTPREEAYRAVGPGAEPSPSLRLLRRSGRQSARLQQLWTSGLGGIWLDVPIETAD